MIRGELEAELTASKVLRRRGPVRFDVSPSGSGLLIVGGFSMGDDGWTLTGYARRHRNRILASVVAVQSSEHDTGQMTEIDYSLMVSPIRPGRHFLQVRHVIRPPVGQGQARDLVVFESIVTVD